MRLAILALLFALSACASLPRSGPAVADIAEAAADESPSVPFLLVDLSPLTAELARAPASEVRLSAGASPRGERFAPGDRVTVTLFEPTGGGLLGAGQAGDGGGAMRSLPAQTIDPQGRIRVPFAGPVAIGGLTPAAAAERIERALTGQAIDPQAIVALAASPTTAVTVLGDAVNGGARVPFTGSGERILDVVAQAGGFSKPLHETVIRLSRRQAVETVRADELLARPDQNVPVEAGDLIAVEHRPRHFVVLGAVGSAATVPFARSGLKLAEAIGQGAGLLDERANPEGVFVVRQGHVPALLGQPGVTAPAGGAVPMATVFRLDLTQPAGLVTAQRFDMAEGDLLFVANARITPAEKVLRLVSLTLAPINSAIVFGNVFGQ